VNTIPATVISTPMTMSRVFFSVKRTSPPYGPPTSRLTCCHRQNDLSYRVVHPRVR
jgi:hypothetical protein